MSQVDSAMTSDLLKHQHFSTLSGTVCKSNSMHALLVPMRQNIKYVYINQHVNAPELIWFQCNLGKYRHHENKVHTCNSSRHWGRFSFRYQPSWFRPFGAHRSYRLEDPGLSEGTWLQKWCARTQVRRKPNAMPRNQGRMQQFLCKWKAWADAWLHLPCYPIQRRWHWHCQQSWHCTWPTSSIGMQRRLPIRIQYQIGPW